MLDVPTFAEISVTRVFPVDVVDERRGYESDVKGLTKGSRCRFAASEGDGINGRNYRRPSTKIRWQMRDSDETFVQRQARSVLSRECTSRKSLLVVTRARMFV